MEILFLLIVIYFGTVGFAPFLKFVRFTKVRSDASKIADLLISGYMDRVGSLESERYLNTLVEVLMSEKQDLEYATRESLQIIAYMQVTASSLGVPITFPFASTCAITHILSNRYQRELCDDELRIISEVVADKI